jgi:hypothetical protein
MRIALIPIIFLCACASEPRGIIYEFKMINDTDSDYVVKRHYRDANNGSRLDTLFAGSEMIFDVPRVGSYGESFGDQLINSFFDTLHVKLMDTKKEVNVHRRFNWKEKAELGEDFLEKPGSMKGKVIYTLKMGTVAK